MSKETKIILKIKFILNNILLDANSLMWSNYKRIAGSNQDFGSKPGQKSNYFDKDLRVLKKYQDSLNDHEKYIRS